MSEYEIIEYNSSMNDEWDDFVSRNSSSVYHTIGWKNVIEKTYGFKPFYRVIRKEEKTVALFCGFIANTLSGKALISQPFAEYGGFCIEPGNEAVTGLVLAEIKNMIPDKIKFAEIRSLPIAPELTFSKVPKALDFRLDIKGKNYEKDIWDGLYTKKSGIRKSVRRAESAGMIIRQERNIDVYYSLYMKLMKRLGSPPHKRAFFENIEKIPQSRFTIAYVSGKPTAGMISFVFKDTLILYGLVSDINYQSLRPNDFLYNEQIKFAAENSMSCVDFGRTRPHSSYVRYKKKWGATKSTLYSYVYPEKSNVNAYKFLSVTKIIRKMPWILTRTPLGNYLKKRNP